MFFYNESGRTVAQIGQGGGGCPTSGTTQGQVGWGSEQPDVVENAPAHVGSDHMTSKCPLQSNHSVLQDRDGCSAEKLTV